MPTENKNDNIDNYDPAAHFVGLRGSNDICRKTKTTSQNFELQVLSFCSESFSSRLTPAGKTTKKRKMCRVCTTCLCKKNASEKIIRSDVLSKCCSEDFENCWVPRGDQTTFDRDSDATRNRSWVELQGVFLFKLLKRNPREISTYPGKPSSSVRQRESVYHHSANPFRN